MLKMCSSVSTSELRELFSAKSSAKLSAALKHNVYTSVKVIMGYVTRDKTITRVSLLGMLISLHHSSTKRESI